MDDILRRAIRESADVILSVNNILDRVIIASQTIFNSFLEGGKLLIFGNGGSAADAQHFSAELVGKFRRSERKALPAIAITTDTSAITAISNDWEYPYVFERQIEALGKKGDVAFGISTSGKSLNVIRALAKAKEIGMKTIALVGSRTEEVEKVSDIVIPVRSKDTQRIQEAHGLIIHLICEAIDIMMSEKQGNEKHEEP